MTTATPTRIHKKIMATHNPLSQNQQIYFCGLDYFDSLIQDINQAKHSILMQTFIFSHDTLGNQISSALIKASKRGVKIKILVDGVGTPQWNNTYAKELESVGIETRVYHPYPWNFWDWSRSVVKKNFLLKGLYLLLSINKRNHRKICIIDNSITYIGSFNIDKSHLPKNKGGSGWRDTGIRMIHQSINELNQSFENVWNHRNIKERIRTSFKYVIRNPAVRLNDGRHRRRILYKNLLKNMRLAKKRIWITNAYFVPDNMILRRLIQAARNGIDVRILLPEESDIFLIKCISSCFYTNLLLNGVRIFEYSPSMLHAKTLIIDNWMLIGSSNINSRSLIHDLEVDIRVSNKKVKEKLEQQFIIDLEKSQEVSFQNWRRPAWYYRLIGRLSMYIRYWL